MSENNESFQSLGGKARSEKLSKEEKSAIASAAAAARWGILRATHEDKPLKIGDHIIPCAVLEGGIRVLSERAVTKALGGKRGGSHWLRKKEDGAELPVYLSASNLKPFIDSELMVALRPIVYAPKSGGKAYGLRADLLPKICKVLLKARRDEKMHWKQAEIVKQAEILQEGLAEVGIIALVDAATGYERIRDQIALQAILDRYLTDEWSKWSKTFPDEFFTHLFRLKKVDFPLTKDGKKPQYVGHWLNDLIYSRLAPGIKEELRRKNPRSSAGNKARKDWQHLTAEVGNPALKELISNEIFLMKGCATDEEFKKKLDLAAPKYGDTMPMNLD